MLSGLGPCACGCPPTLIPNQMLIWDRAMVPEGVVGALGTLQRSCGIKIPNSMQTPPPNTYLLTHHTNIKDLRKY